MERLRRLHWPGMTESGVVAAIAYADRAPVRARHRGLPSPYLTVVVMTSPDPVICEGEVGGPTSPWAWTSVAAGLGDRAVRLTLPRLQRGVQLTLDPLAARHLLGMPAGELPARGVAADEALGSGVAELAERLAGAGADDTRVDAEADAQAAVVAAWLARRAATTRHTGVRAEVAQAWRLVLARRGRWAIGGLAREVGLSERQLRALMRAELGVSPKTACRLARLDHAVERIVGGRDRTLADTAAAAGYADHAHLDADFAAAVGCSPSAWLVEERRNIQAGGHRNRAD